MSYCILHRTIFYLKERGATFVIKPLSVETLNKKQREMIIVDKDEEVKEFKARSGRKSYAHESKP